MAVAKGNRTMLAEVPETIIRRLPIYHRYLSELANGEVEKISSLELAIMMGSTASQIRKDLSWFGSFGQQGYGYRVNELLDELNEILDLTGEVTMVVIGGGNLGRAVISYPGFQAQNFIVKAVFDNNPVVIGNSLNGLTVTSIRKLPNYLRNNSVQIGVISTPVSAAQEAADLLVDGGIRGIWNFVPLKLRVPPHIAVEYVHIIESLMFLSFQCKLRANNNNNNKENGGNDDGEERNG